MLRKILAIVVAVVAGGVFNMMLVKASHVAYPFPEGVNPDDMESLKAHVTEHGLPFGALLIVLAAHAGGSLVSGLVCGLIAKQKWIACAVGMGLFWTCGGIAMLFILPAPLWFAVADLAMYVPAAVVGVLVGGSMTGPLTPPSEVHP